MWLTMIFLAGVLHGLGPDHLAAITAFGIAVGHDFRRVTSFSLRFAGGHALVIAGAALLAHFGRMTMAASWDRGFDLCAASLLLLTGLGLLVGLFTGHVSIHAHHHYHGAGHHEHVHAHLGSGSEHEHGKPNLAFLLGGLFALGGLRSLVVIVPAALAHTLAISLLRISAFALGILVSMSAYGFLAGGTLNRFMGNTTDSGRQRFLFRLTTATVGILSIVAGMITLGERWHA